jgi:hypothetical protein
MTKIATTAMITSNASIGIVPSSPYSGHYSRCATGVIDRNQKWAGVGLAGT